MPSWSSLSALGSRVQTGSVAAKTFLKKWAARLTPGEPTRRLIARFLIAATVLLGAVAGRGFNLGFGRVADVALGAAQAALFLLLGWLATKLIPWLFGLLKRFWTLAGVLALGVVIYLGLEAGLTWDFALEFAVGFVLVEALLVVAAGGLLHAKTTAMRLVAGLGLVLTLGINAAGIWAALDAGGGTDPTRAFITPRRPAPAVYTGLLERGPWKVAALTYGSGSDKRRSEFAEGVAFKTPPVDASKLLTGLKGWKAATREWLWGFGANALPLNARVWYPEGRTDAAPLVLVVHGNHAMMAYSDPGYAYIGEHLASRGFIVASIDENFLNSSMFLAGMAPENQVRGWLLLEHLRQWRAWNQDPAHPFHGKVDLERVILIGHSRGGEAVGVAAAFNALPFAPDDARVAFDFRFGIRGVIAIAPVDGQYLPSQKRTPITDVSYLTLHGGYDGDVTSFHGDRQFQRVALSPSGGHFKAAVYFHHANHGQFNTTWGAFDRRIPGAWLLNRAPFMSGEDQRRAGLLFMTAFVEERLLGRGELRPLFRDPAVAGEALPPTLYLSRYAEGEKTVLADFEGRIDLTVGTLPGSSLQGEHLRLWKEADLGFRRDSNPRFDTAAVLGWERTQGPVPSYRVDLSGPLALSRGSVLALDLVQLDQDPPGKDGEKKSAPKTDPSALRPPVDFTLQLTDGAGKNAALPLSRFAHFLPPLPVRHSKLGGGVAERFGKPVEAIIQSVRLPLSVFAEASPGFNPMTLKAVTLLFDQSERGVIAVSEISVYPAN